MVVAVRCPFCGADRQVSLPPGPGSHRLQCDRCHRTCLVEVKVSFGLFRSVTTRML